MSVSQEVPECSDKRLDEPGGVMEKMPVQDGLMASLNICYSEVAAQLIDANRIQQGQTDGFVTNPVYLSLNADKSLSGFGQYGVLYDGSILNGLDSKKFIFGNEFGSVCDAVRGVRGKQLCSDKAMPDLSTKQDFVNVWERTSSNAEKYSVFECPVGKQSPYVAAGSTISIIQSLAEQECDQSTRVPMPDMTCASNLRKTPRKNEVILDQALKKGLPAGVEVCDNFLFKAGPKMYFDSMDDEASKVPVHQMMPDNCSGHSMLVIGRRKNPKTNKCQYLLRNSWGVKACQYYRGLPSSDCDKNGQTWVDDDTLLTNTKNVDVVF